MLDGDSLLSSLPLPLTEVRLQHLMVLRLSTNATEITDGYFASRHDGLNGRILRGAGGWLVRLRDGRMMLDGRLALSTASGEAIAVRFIGRRPGESDPLTALDRGDDLRPDAYYLRLCMSFETHSARFSWLNSTLAVAKGEYRPERPIFNVLQLL